MRSHSEILNALIAVAEEAVTRPQLLHGRFGEAFAKLAAEVRHADALPAENIRTTRAAVVMTIAIEQFLGGDREPTSQWLGLAGTALPLLRGEAWVALNNEKAARGS